MCSLLVCLISKVFILNRTLRTPLAVHQSAAPGSADCGVAHILAFFSTDIQCIQSKATGWLVWEFLARRPHDYCEPLSNLYVIAMENASPDCICQWFLAPFGWNSAVG